MPAASKSQGANGAVEFAQGEVLFEQDTPALRMYVLREGSVRLSRRVVRESMTLEDVGRGSVVGDLSLVPGAAYDVTAVALEPVSALAITAEDLEAGLVTDPQVLLRVSRRLATRLAWAHFRLGTLALRTTEGRVMAQLRAEASAAGALTGAAWAPLPYDMPEAIAAEAGSVRNALEELVRSGVLEVDGNGRFRVADFRAFERRLAWHELNDRIHG